MQLFNVLLVIFLFPLQSEANLNSFKSDKNKIGIITVYSTFSFFVLSLIIFISSLLGFIKNRKLRQWKLSEPQVHIYYKDKGKAPKLKRQVLEAMDKGGSIYKKSKKSNKTQDSTMSSINTESGSLNLPASKERL